MALQAASPLSESHITPPSAERASAIHSFPFGTGPVNEMCTFPGSGAVSTWPAASLSTFAFRSAALVRSSTSMVIANEALEKREVTVMVCFFLEEGTCGVPPMQPGMPFDPTVQQQVLATPVTQMGMPAMKQGGQFTAQKAGSLGMNYLHQCESVEVRPYCYFLF